MQRRRLLATLAVAPLSARSGAQPPAPAPTLDKLAETVYMLSGAGGNVGLAVGDDAVFLIDNQLAPMTPRIRAAIATLTRQPVRFVINTHFHYDHVGGNEALAGSGAVIVAHDHTRRRLSSEQFIALIGRRQEPTPKGGLPVVTVAGEMTLHLNGDEVHVFHVPSAHTDGDLVVHFRRSDVVHMGDTFYGSMFPLIDGSAGGTADGLIAAQERVLTSIGDRTKVIPGHGALSDKAGLQAVRDMLVAVTRRIRDARRAGRSDEQIVVARPAADFDARFGGGFIDADRFVAMLLGVMAR